MKRILLGLSALALSAGVAHADPYANLYANTLSITGSDGSTSTVFVNQDMSWEQHLPKGMVLKGTYAWKDAQTACFTIVPAPALTLNSSDVIPSGNRYGLPFGRIGDLE